MRVALAATLFAEPDLLLLDEPTNYLDLEGTLWLEDHLARYPRTVIIVSHDRDLLENSVDQILHLDRSKLTLYSGGYSSFEKQRAARELLDAKQVKRQEAERKRLQAFVDRFKAKASKARQAQSRVKKLEKMQPIAALVTQDVREIVFPEPDKLLSPPIIAVDDVSVGYDPEKPVLSRVTLRIDNDDRIALLGQNGNGKSTLVKLLAGRLAPFSGHVTRADKLSVGYFAQHQLDELNEDGSPYTHIRKLLPDAPEAKVRARAGAIGFSAAAADTPVKNLSGGEKARLLLGLATFFGPQLIILDEPTNHLDIDSRAALAEAINEFPGAVIMVSHDRYLIDACADRLWVVANRAVSTYDGDLDDYSREILSARGQRTPRTRPQREAGGAPRTNTTKQNRPLRQKDRGRRGRDRTHQRASSPRSTRRWRCRIFSRASRQRRLSSARRAVLRRKPCSARKRIGWRQALLSKRHQAEFIEGSALTLRAGPWRCARWLRLGAALHRDHPPVGKAVDARTRSADIGQHRHAPAAFSRKSRRCPGRPPRARPRTRCGRWRCRRCPESARPRLARSWHCVSAGAAMPAQ